MRLAFGGADEGVDGLEHDGLAVGRQALDLLHAAEHFQAGSGGAGLGGPRMEQVVGSAIDTERCAQFWALSGYQQVCTGMVQEHLLMSRKPLRCMGFLPTE